MIKWILQKIVGNKNQREIKRLKPIIEKINEVEEALQQESPEVLLALTQKWKTHLHRYLPLSLPSKRKLALLSSEERAAIAQNLNTQFESLKEEFPELDLIVENTETSISEARSVFQSLEEKFTTTRDQYLNQILPEAYAVVKNGSRRLCGQELEVCEQKITWNMVHYDTQLIGGVCLHRGLIAEMQTGEGKTLVSTLPVYLNALTGLGVHIVTVNDYLARRDAEWMGYLFRYLGLTSGVLQSQMSASMRKKCYQADITYGTNSEFGFDYLRDNGMASSIQEQVQKNHYFAIIDEVDSILIDEARTPLIISGPSVINTTQQYDKYRPFVERLVRKQNILCNRLADEAKKAFEKGDTELSGKILFKLKTGQPRNRQFMRMMEDPALRRNLEKSELTLYEDTQKKDLFTLKEELYYTVDEKSHEADLMEKGRNFLSPEDPEAFVLPDLATAYGAVDADLKLSDEKKSLEKEKLQTRLDNQGEKIHSISQLLKAYCLYEKDVEYVLKDNKVVIVDENTGREMEGRRWSDGLHQAVEAKEGCAIEKETQTYATITIQNYFRLYEKLAGMTGTAETDAAEFHDIYCLDVLPIPTNKPNQRIDENDHVYKTRREKYNAVIEKIRECHERKQPVLVGTASVETSETVGRMLKRAKLPHQVLNAKFHKQEAEIIQSAGLKEAITVSTNMAGRGTDIKLEEGVSELGGLYVIGTERHTSRRVDRQLRGRCARQGDPGKTQFFLSFEDDLMRNFANVGKMTSILERFGMEDGESIEDRLLNRSIETAQKRVEQAHYRQRKYVLDFDDVMNKQREIVYGYRKDALTHEDPRKLIYETIEEVIPQKLEFFTSINKNDEDPEYQELFNWVNTTFPIGIHPKDHVLKNMSNDEISKLLITKIKEAYELKIQHEKPEFLDELELHIILSSVDELWQKHLYSMDSIRQGVGLRQHGQKDPLVEYKTEAYSLFLTLMQNIKEGILANLFRSTTNIEQYENFLRNLPMEMSNEALLEQQSETLKLPQIQPTLDGLSQQEESHINVNIPKRRPSIKIGRNEPCSCGSGKKSKNCCPNS